MEFKYSDYCTAFYIPESAVVCIYDEINEGEMQRIPAASERHAVELIEAWEFNAPQGIIAEPLI